MAISASLWLSHASAQTADQPAEQPSSQTSEPKEPAEPVEPDDAASDPVEDEPKTEQGKAAVTAYAAGRNVEAGRLGLLALVQEPDNPGLRLKVANALAWSGKYPDALRQYRALADTPFATEGLLGQANVSLWSGRPDLADPLYRQVLAIDAKQSDATEGLAKARRQLRPRTSLSLSGMRDSDESQRAMLGVTHQWRDDSLSQIFELSAEGGQEQRIGTVPNLDPREIGLSFEHLGAPLSPKLKVSAQQSPMTKVFGELGVKLADGAVGIQIGRVNWGKLAFNPLARQDGLTANRIGVNGRTNTDVGEISANVTHFAVSDGNSVYDAGLQFTPAWQPLPDSSGVKLFTGLYGHKSAREDERYWTPVTGYYTAFIGVNYGRWEADWELYGEIKHSALVGGEGTGGWSVGGGGKRWIHRDWAIRAETFLLDSGRSGSGYRSRALSIALDHVW